MKWAFTILLLGVLSMTSTTAEDLKKLSLDDESHFGTTILADTKVKSEGKGSIKISTQWPTTVCLAVVDGPDVEDAILVYTAKVKSEIDGMAFLELWAHLNGGQYFSRGLNDIVSQKTDWKTIKTPFVFQKGQKPEKVTLNIVINGKGTLWVDDIVLSKEPIK